jgi:GNAT superfamily N-acetyltransferase
VEWTRDSLVITDDRARIDRDVVHRYLRDDSYWSQGVPRDVVDRSIDNSLCLSLFDGADQIGFARLITDRSTFSFLADVFVLPSHRGRGLARWLVQTVLDHPDLEGQRRILLGTDDAHGLYAQLGFTPLAQTERFMDIFRPAPAIYAGEAVPPS